MQKISEISDLEGRKLDEKLWKSSTKKKSLKLHFCKILLTAVGKNESPLLVLYPFESPNNSGAWH